MAACASLAGCGPFAISNTVLLGSSTAVAGVSGLPRYVVPCLVMQLLWRRNVQPDQALLARLLPTPAEPTHLSFHSGLPHLAHTDPKPPAFHVRLEKEVEKTAIICYLFCCIKDKSCVIGQQDMTGKSCLTECLWSIPYGHESCSNCPQQFLMTTADHRLTWPVRT